MSNSEQREIPVEQLTIGLTVKLPLSWKNHPFLFNKIEIKEEAEIELIKSLGVTYVILISGEELLPEVKPVESIDPQNEIEKAEADPQFLIKKSLRLSQKRFIESVNQSQAAFGQIGSDPEGGYRSSAGLVEELLEHMLEFDEPTLALVSAGESDVNITQHSISVSVIALMIAKALQLPKANLRTIALACLYHDIGKLKVPDVIRRKKGKLTKHEHNFMKMHPNFGYEMLHKTGLYQEEVLQAILHHHEFIDGSGYPDGMKGKKIPLITQIISLANDYEDILSQEKLRSPQVALALLFKKRAGKHAESLIAVLVKLLGIYPPGTLVELADHSIGKVMMTTKDVKQPHVLACKSDGSDVRLRFLSEEQLSIEKMIKFDELSEGAVKALQADMEVSFYFGGLVN